MRPISLSFDVTDVLPSDVTQGKRISIAAWLFVPDDLRLLGPKPVVMALLSGGSYDKRYFHIQIPGYSGYSAAEHLAALGNIVLVPDHLGVGESARVPDQKRATRRIAALANHAAVTQFYERLRGGGIHPKLPALREFVKVGGGHSMGGMQTVVQQAAFRTYEAMMVLGYTAIGVHFTIGGKLLRADAYPPNAPPGDYLLGSREFLHESFHWEDVPAAVVAADDAMAVETPSVIGMESINTGIIAEDAGQIDVPTYICLAERDVSPDPHGEPARYKQCRDLMLHILPRSGHCQNFASTRHQMWNRMHAWARCVTA
ncbi:MAG: alpha/beta fold hydrolase [Rhodospirillaceae bacterium]|nr:MAG: alpha/beta fold hydrolase [Rhodospirillaceae bacterium]